MPRWRPGDEHRIEPPPRPRLARLLRRLTPLERWHRYEVHGLEHVPAAGPALVVSPHSYALLDWFLLAKRLFERDGRWMRGLTHHGVFLVPLLRDVFSAFGILDGTPENGRRLLDAGQLAATMPGGARDWARPHRERRTLRWGENRGYARLAVRAGVPVIPTACPAAEKTYLVLNDGWRVARPLQRLLGAPYPFPITLALGLGPFPWPVKLEQLVAPPEWPRNGGAEEESARDLDRRVRAVLEGLLRG